MAFLVIKSIHVMGVVAWFAGLFYIFRIYVYHTENQGRKEITDVLKVMEYRLYYGITWPAMVLATAMGVIMLSMNPGLLNLGWMRVKLVVVLLLFGYHFFSGHVRKEFLKGNFFLTGKQCRFINEVPTLVLIIVVLLAVVKPF